MKNKLLLLVCVCFFLPCYNCMGKEEAKEYIVISFEKIIKGDSNSIFHWIIPLDSIMNQKHFPITLLLKPLYLDDSSEFNIKRCLQGDTINYLNGSEKASLAYVQFVRNIESVIKKNRKVIQKIKLKWKYPSTTLTVEDQYISNVTIYVYATPLKGFFKECVQQHYNGSELELNQRVFLPVKDIIYNEAFWETKVADLIKNTNYAYVNFSCCVPSGFGEKDISVAVNLK